MWRSCQDNQLYNTTPPDNWINIPYTGVEGGTCYERVLLTFSENKLQFEKTNFSGIPFVAKTIKVTNTSETNTYRVNLATEDKLFTLSKVQLTLLPKTEESFTVTIPIEKEQNFALGKTVVKLETRVTKL